MASRCDESDVPMKDTVYDTVLPQLGESLPGPVTRTAFLRFQGLKPLLSIGS